MWQDLFPELVFEILSHFLPNLQLAVCEPDSFPWYLGHVCKSWRSVFITSPEFWSVIAVDFDLGLFNGNWSSNKDALAIVARAASLVEMSLDRGKDLSLRFEYITGIREPHVLGQAWSIPPHYLRILEMLVAQSARWRDARIVLDARELPTLHAGKRNFPQLHSLQLLVTDGSRTGSPCRNLFEDAEHLTQVSLSNISVWRMNWQSLKALEIHAPAAARFQDVIDVLQETRCLEKLVIHQPYPYDISDMLDNIIPVILPSLTTLYLEGATLLPFIMAPSLRSLWIQNSYHNYEKYYSKEEFHAYVSAFFSPLQHLRFMTLAPWSGKDAHIFLQCMPKVDHLCLVTRLVDVLECLATSCPNALHLQELSIELMEFCRHALHEAGVILASMVKSNEGRIQRIDVVSAEVSMVKDSPGSINSPSFVQLKQTCEELGVRLATLSIWTYTYDLVRTSAFDVISI